MKDILFLPIFFASDLIFFLCLPLLAFFCWGRYFYKKIFKQKPKILFSPRSLTMVFLTARAVKTQGWDVGVITYDREKTFQAQKLGFCFKEHPVLSRLVYLFDYLPIFVWSLLKFDIFEFPFYGGLLYQSHLRKLELIFLKICAKKIVVFAYGSDAYLPSRIRKFGKYNAVMDFTSETPVQPEKIIADNIYRAQKYADVLIAGADIVYLGPKAIMLPIAIDLDRWSYIPPRRKKTVTLVHSTNHQIYKGTRFILKVFDNLKKEGYPVDLLLIEGKTVEECYKIYKKGDIFVPDVITGWYGSTQIEAMSLGRPVVSYQKEIFKPYHHYYAKDCPIINANPDNLKRVFIKLVGDYNLRREIGHRGIEYVHKYHSLEFVGELRGIIYRELWHNRPIDQKRFEKILKAEKIIEKK